MRTIYEPTGRAREYSELALNLYEGCSFGCEYCFNTKMPWCDKEKFYRAEVRVGILEQLDICAGRMAGDPREILLCFTCDPYPGRPRDEITREALLILEKHKMKVQILSKAGPAAVRDFDILERNNWRYGITVSGDHETSLFYEPFAAPVWDRILSLSRAHHMGLRTFVSFEPVLNATWCCDLMKSDRFRSLVNEIRIGKINYMPAVEKLTDWHDFLVNACQSLIGYQGNVIIKKDLLAYDTQRCEKTISEAAV